MPISQPRDAASCRILVMDDEQLVREAITMLLEAMQYGVLAAEHGAQALELVAALPETDRSAPLIALLDLNVLDGMGGREVVQPLKQLAPHLKAVAMSGRPDDPHVSDFRQSGFDAVLPKPFQARQLNELIRRLIGESAE